MSGTKAEAEEYTAYLDRMNYWSYVLDHTMEEIDKACDAYVLSIGGHSWWYDKTDETVMAVFAHKLAEPEVIARILASNNNG